MKRILLTILAITLCLFAFAGCSNKSKYDTDWIIGKTSQEIIEVYGDFDCTLMPANEDGLYSKCKCGYTIKEAQQGFFGMSEEKLLFITFDENSIAIECEEGYRPGG